jgi:hypothetical protein
MDVIQGPRVLALDYLVVVMTALGIIENCWFYLHLSSYVAAGYALRLRIETVLAMAGMGFGWGYCVWTCGFRACDRFVLTAVVDATALTWFASAWWQLSRSGKIHSVNPMYAAVALHEEVKDELVDDRGSLSRGIYGGVSYADGGGAGIINDEVVTIEMADTRPHHMKIAAAMAHAAAEDPNWLTTRTHEELTAEEVRAMQDEATSDTEHPPPHA